MSKENIYTETVVARMVEEYKAAKSDEARASVVENFADELHVRPQSVRAKLVNLKVYIAKKRTSKTGEAVEHKAAIVSDIAKSLNVDEERIESLEKATKPVLKMVRDALFAQNSSETSESVSK